MEDIIRRFSTRRKQAYAALCLAKFCAAKHIQHPAINELIEHLLELLISTNLPQWEKIGGSLELDGLGDPLPDSVKAILPEEISQNDFHELVIYTVEVGVVDMYSAPTAEPLRMLEACIAKLQAHGVAPPSLESDFWLRCNEADHPVGWGDPVSNADYQQVVDTYRCIMSK